MGIKGLGSTLSIIFNHYQQRFDLTLVCLSFPRHLLYSSQTLDCLDSFDLYASVPTLSALQTLLWWYWAIPL